MRLGFFYWGVLYLNDGHYTCDDATANAASALAKHLGAVEMVAMVDDSGRREGSEILQIEGLTIHALPHCASGGELHLKKALPLASSVKRLVDRRSRHWDGAIIWESPQPNQWGYMFSRLRRLPLVLVLAGRPGKALVEAYRHDRSLGGLARRAYGRYLNGLTARWVKRVPTLADVDLDLLYPGEALDWGFYCFGRWGEGEQLPGAGVRELKPGQPLTVLSASRITPVKGIEHLIEAVGILKGRGVELKLIIAGEEYSGMYGGYSGKLHHMVSSLGPERLVSFVGRLGREEMMQAYRDCHLLAMSATSNAEGVPKIIPEAMAMGLPVVSSKVGSVFRVVRPGENGLLVKPRSAPELAGALASLAGNPGFYRELSRGALAAASVQMLPPETKVQREARSSGSVALPKLFGPAQANSKLHRASPTAGPSPRR